MIGVNAVPPMPPRLEIEKQPPCISAGPSLPSRAFADSAPISAAIASTPFWSAFLITGTTRPFGVSKSVTRPVWDGKAFAPRLMVPLSFSYDHRVIDGASAARFTYYLATLLADMRRVML